MYAVVASDQITEIHAKRPKYHPTVEIVTVAKKVGVGWVRDGDGWSPPVGIQMDLDAAKASALAVVARLHADALVYLSGNATPADRDTWIMKRDAARAFLRGDTEDEDGDDLAAFLTGLFGPGEADAIAENGGDPARVMAEKIVGKSRLFKSLVARAEASKREGEAAVEAAAELGTEALSATVEAIQTAASERREAFAQSR